jgi:hypothetical protein
MAAPGDQFVDEYRLAQLTIELEYGGKVHRSKFPDIRIRKKSVWWQLLNRNDLPAGLAEDVRDFKNADLRVDCGYVLAGVTRRVTRLKVDKADTIRAVLEFDGCEEIIDYWVNLHNEFNVEIRNDIDTKIKILYHSSHRTVITVEIHKGD